MSFWKESVRLALATGALLIAAQGQAFGQSRPTTILPGAPAPLPDLVPLSPPGATSFPAARRLLGGPALAFPSAFDSGGVANYRPGGFSVRLLSRMSREALRYRSENAAGGLAGYATAPGEGFDSATEESRSAAASRVIIRSTRRALDEEFDRMARSSLGLAPALDFLQNVSFRRLRPGSAAPLDGARATGGPAAAPAGEPARMRADIGLRLDAHPALLLRARFLGLRGRIEVPVRGEPLRFSMESPVGPRGRAVLSSGLPRDGQGWATLTFSFSF